MADISELWPYLAWDSAWGLHTGRYRTYLGGDLCAHCRGVISKRAADAMRVPYVHRQVVECSSRPEDDGNVVSACVHDECIAAFNAAGAAVPDPPP